MRSNVGHLQDLIRTEDDNQENMERGKRTRFNNIAIDYQKDDLNKVFNSYKIFGLHFCIKNTEGDILLKDE